MSKQQALIKVFQSAVLGTAAFPTFALSFYGSGDNCMIHPLSHFHASLIAFALVLPPLHTFFLQVP